MSLTPGARLGPYEVLGSLGAGGMGEVYRARDARLDRDVAIKVLPESFAADSVRLERFAREARAASALNHPNILTIHELGTHDGAPYIVSELLDGTELRALMTGRPVAVRKAIDYATQILSGLAAAHDKGIVHRDLKPENIFVTRDGRVKILDFGLAKLERVDPKAGGSSMTRANLTDTGVVMGTAAYMSPEQVRGQQADHRSDLFSFGVILYELLAGRPAFARQTGAETMTAVLNEEPQDFEGAGGTMQPALDRIVRRCLDKAPDRRFHSADDLGFALSTVQTLADRSGSGPAAPVAGASRTTGALRTRERVLWAAAALLLVSGAVTWSRAWPAAVPVSDGQAMRLSFPPSDKTSFGQVAVSPDGRWVAYTGTTGATVHLWVRSMGEAAARPLAGTEGAVLPFWSPDSRFIGYFTAGKLRKIDFNGGVSTALADSGVSTGGTWSRDGTIVFGSLGGSGLSKVPAAGGQVESVRAPDLSRQETDFSNPHFLPDGRHYFYNIFSGQREGRGIFLEAVSGFAKRRERSRGGVVTRRQVAGLRIR